MNMFGKTYHVRILRSSCLFIYVSVYDTTLRMWLCRLSMSTPFVCVCNMCEWGKVQLTGVSIQFQFYWWDGHAFKWKWKRTSAVYSKVKLEESSSCGIQFRRDIRFLVANILCSIHDSQFRVDFQTSPVIRILWMVQSNQNALKNRLLVGWHFLNGTIKFIVRLRLNSRSEFRHFECLSK